MARKRKRKPRKKKVVVKPVVFVKPIEFTEPEPESKSIVDEAIQI